MAQSPGALAMGETIFHSRTEISAQQLEQLRSLLVELFPGNKFYSRKLSEAGITFDVSGLEDFSERFPFTTKAEIAQDQRDHTALVGYPRKLGLDGGELGRDFACGRGLSRQPALLRVFFRPVYWLLARFRSRHP